MSKSQAYAMAASFDLQAELIRLQRENAYLQQRVRELEKAQSDAGWEREYYWQLENDRPQDGWK